MKRARVAIAVLVMLVAATASASPFFSIGTQAEWEEALREQRIIPVSAQVFQDMVLGDPQWPSEYEEALFFTPEVQVFADFKGEPGLYMQWGSDSVPPDQRIAAAWDYVYAEDPSLAGATIEFSIFPPVPSTLVSLNLIDKWGNYREWIWHAGGQGELPPGQWSTLVINPVTGASNWPTFGGSPFIHNVAGGPPFDFSSIQILRFDENISATGGFPPGPAGNIPPGWVWNMWDHVEVTPEPATLVLLGGGLLVLARRRRRTR